MTALQAELKRTEAALQQAQADAAQQRERADQEASRVLVLEAASNQLHQQLAAAQGDASNAAAQVTSLSAEKQDLEQQLDRLTEHLDRTEVRLCCASSIRYDSALDDWVAHALSVCCICWSPL